MPHAADGKRIEPPVSVPSAAVQSPAATATPDPLEEMPVQRASFQGLTGGSTDGWWLV